MTVKHTIQVNKVVESDTTVAETMRRLVIQKLTSQGKSRSGGGKQILLSLLAGSPSAPDI